MRLQLNLLIHCLLVFQVSIYGQDNDEVCLSREEFELFELINSYRESKGLSAVPYSPSLTAVAQTHSKDLMLNHPDKSSRCNMHSWSQDARWSDCCYTEDHKKAACMWDKPRELTSYEGDGFEIAHYSSPVNPETNVIFPEKALEGWIKSKSHHDVILNRSIWKDTKWKAMGVGIYGEYAVVWFGKVPEGDGQPVVCD